jgi:histone H3/H4
MTPKIFGKAAEKSG